MRLPMKLYRLVLVLLIYVHSACSVSKVSRQPISSGHYCEPGIVYPDNAQFAPLSTLPSDTSLTNHWSAHTLLMANAVGIIPLLHQLTYLPVSADLQTQFLRTSLRQQIQSRLLLASVEIASLAAELDCEGERADQLATYLDQQDQKRIRNLTLLSVILGAITTVATALIPADNTDKIVGIGGGLLSAGLGSGAALSSKKTVLFQHERNLLTDIWTADEQSLLYAPFIWYVLNEKEFSNTRRHSIRANIKRRWQQYGVVGMTPEQQQLLFGRGGNYQADALHTRANMLNQLQSSIRSINQDLQSLLLALTR